MDGLMFIGTTSWQQDILSYTEGMGEIRKQYSPTFKARVVLELLRETRSVSELAAEYGVHPTQLQRWRKAALEKLPQVFARESSWEEEKARYDARINELYAEIGRLSTQLNWLKKKGLDFEP